jgi:uncharacterized protein YjbI with pentapeptide repeats
MDAHPSFVGNSEDFKHFLSLAQSPVRSEKREEALREWEQYKLERQMAYVRRRDERVRKRGVWTKGAYMHALTAPAIDLRGASVPDICIGYADLRGVRFDGAQFTLGERGWTSLKGAKLENASFVGASMPRMRLIDADLRGADLTNADLADGDLTGANLERATLRGANLKRVSLLRASLVGADVTGCELDGAGVYGVSAWDLRGRPTSSKDLIVTPGSVPAITADDVRVAQFIYLMISNAEIRDVLDTVTRKVVLLLGRFTPARKAVLDGLRDALRERDLVPVLFDFEKPQDRDITETVTLLARMARFVIADLTDPASIPQELEATVPHVAVPVSLIVLEGSRPYSMSADLRKYSWVIKPFRYRDQNHLLANIDQEIVARAEQKRAEIAKSRVGEGW